ncbi:hypothetical protein [Actinocrispum sp. NPDC049592]|uniref:hypothetical protein n=1 Tax=Actinocrispum sp. NPDC049592 TaxID=3154835 RepID=UPI00341DEAC8
MSDVDHPGMLTDLTDTERKLIDAARLGVWLTCGTLGPDDLKDTDDPRYHIRGEVIRELLLGRHGEIDPHGIRISHARITGKLDVAHIHAPVGLYLRHSVFDDVALFHNAHFPRIDLTGTHLPGLYASGLQVDGALHLRYKFTVHGDGERGAVNLMGARIGGSLSFSDATLSNTVGPALNAERLTVEGALRMRKGFSATGAGRAGAVNLTIAHIKGFVLIDDARITNTSGPALRAGQLRVDGSLNILGGVVLTGGNWPGALDLAGAQIGGSLSFTGAEMVGAGVPAVRAERLRVGDQVVFHRGCTATGGGDRGTVVFKGAQVTGAFDFHGLRIDSTDSLVLNLDSARCAYVICPPDLIEPGKQFFVDGFTYTDISGVDWKRWLQWLRFNTESYLPQPFQQLAATRTAAGHDGDARTILMDQQRDHRARGELGGPLSKFTHAAWGLLAGYGYRTRRTALTLLLVLMFAGVLGLWAGHTSTGPNRFAAERPTATGQCSTVELIGLGIDRGLPLASTGIRTKCDLDTSSTAGQWFTAVIWLLQAAVWALATLALAGYTGLVRKIR